MVEHILHSTYLAKREHRRAAREVTDCPRGQLALPLFAPSIRAVVKRREICRAIASTSVRGSAPYFGAPTVLRSANQRGTHARTANGSTPCFVEYHASHFRSRTFWILAALEIFHLFLTQPTKFFAQVK